MITTSPVNKEMLVSLGLDVSWQSTSFRPSPQQTACLLREAFINQWRVFQTSDKRGTLSERSGITLHSIRHYLNHRFAVLYDATSWDSNQFKTNDLGESDRVRSSDSSLNIFRTIQQLGDFSHLGSGQYIPRESRLVFVAPGWARIAGALNISDAPLPDFCHENQLQETIGRIVFLPDTFESQPTRFELSPVMASRKRLVSLDDRVKPLFESMALRPPIDLSEAEIYCLKRSGNRRLPRWCKIEANHGPALCRLSSGLYLLAEVEDVPSNVTRFVELDGDERKFVEHYFRSKWGPGTRAELQEKNEVFELQLNYSLPSILQLEFQAASSSFEADREYNWLKRFVFPMRVRPLVSALLNVIGINCAQ